MRHSRRAWGKSVTTVAAVGEVAAGEDESAVELSAMLEPR
jgi:hypothetical protein